MKYIRKKITELPSENYRLVYTIVNTNDWNDTLENHPKIIEQSNLYEITDEPIPTDMQLWSVEYEGS